MAEAAGEAFDYERLMKDLQLDDHYPTKEFREIISYLKDLQIIIEELQKSEISCIPDILSKLSLTPPGTKSETIYAYSRVIQKELFQKHEISPKIVHIITTLLRYIIMKLANCSEQDAASILNDFNELKSFIYVFRSSDCCDDVKLDKIIAMFSEKLIKMLKESMNPDNFLTKFDLFAIMRVMIGEFGKNPVYAPVIIKQLAQEVKVYNEMINSLQPDDDLDAYVFECYLNFFYTIDDVLKRNLVDEIHKSDASILPDLYNDLKALTQKKLKKTEEHLFLNIMSLIDIHLQSIESMTYD